MARIGYARVSTLDQEAGLEAQIRDLRAAGCVERDVHIERASAKDLAARPKLEMILDHILHRGDELVVTKVDRIARSIRDLVAIIDRVHQVGAHLHILSLGSTDPASPFGKLTITILGAIAEFEREIMLERQREGIARAKAEGKYKGQPPHVRRQAGEIWRLHAEGLGASAIAERLGVHRSSVWRVLKAPGGAGAVIDGTLSGGADGSKGVAGAAGLRGAAGK